MIEEHVSQLSLSDVLLGMGITDSQAVEQAIDNMLTDNNDGNVDQSTSL